MPSRLGRARAGPGTGRAWPCPGWASYGRGWTRKEPCKSRAELARDRHGDEHRACLEGGHRPGHPSRTAPGPGRPTAWPSRGRAGQTEQFVPGRADRASRAMAPTAQSEPKASRKGPDSPRQDWQTQQPGQARQRVRAKHANGPGPCPWRAGQAPRRDRWRQQSHHPAPRERAAAASTGKQQPGPPKLRHSGLIRRSSSYWPPG
jgi:hypothetical protein